MVWAYKYSIYVYIRGHTKYNITNIITKSIKSQFYNNNNNLISAYINVQLNIKAKINRPDMYIS